MSYVKHGIFNKAEKNLNLNTSSQAAAVHTLPIPAQQLIMRAPLGTTTQFSTNMNPQLQCTLQQTQQDRNRICIYSWKPETSQHRFPFQVKGKNRIG
jgi:hypothetical protein